MGAPIVVFDLDGTLVDSAPDIHAAAARLLAAEGREPLPLETIRSFIGRGVPALIDQICDAVRLRPLDRDRLIAMFLEDYNANAAVLTRPFPGVPECLGFLAQQGFRIGVCTNKPLDPTMAILEALDLIEWIEGVAGGDSQPAKKPDPAGLNSVVDRLGNGTVLYIGDSVIDAETAARARVMFGLFTSGYLNADIATLHYTFRFDDFHALPKVVEKVFAHQGADL